MIFVDTGAFLGRYLTGDQFHEKARRIWEDIEKSSMRLCTSILVISETATLLSRWAGGKFSAERVRSIYASDRIRILRTEKDDELRAIDLIGSRAGRKLSFSDATSMSLMKRLKIRKAFSFDDDFREAGFDLVESKEVPDKNKES